MHIPGLLFSVFGSGHRRHQQHLYLQVFPVPPDHHGQFLPGLQAVELQPGALRGAAGRFQEGFAYQPGEAELAAFDAAFPAKTKAAAPSQQEFAFMCSLGHQVIPNGFM